MIADDHEAFVADLLRAWLATCADRPLSLEDLDRLRPIVAEALRLAIEGVSVQELRLVAAARGFARTSS